MKKQTVLVIGIAAIGLLICPVFVNSLSGGNAGKIGRSEWNTILREARQQRVGPATPTQDCLNAYNRYNDAATIYGEHQWFCDEMERYQITKETMDSTLSRITSREFGNLICQSGQASFEEWVENFRDEISGVEEQYNVLRETCHSYRGRQLDAEEVMLRTSDLRRRMFRLERLTCEACNFIWPVQQWEEGYYRERGIDASRTHCPRP